MFCLTCGGEIKPGSQFCSRCGAAVTYIEKPVNGPVTNPPSTPTPNPIPGKPMVEKPDLGGPDTSAIIAAYRNQTNLDIKTANGKPTSSTKELFYAYAEKNGEILYRKCYESGKFSFAALLLGPTIFIYRRNYTAFAITWVINIVAARILPSYIGLFVNILYGFLYFPMVRSSFESTLQAAKQQNPNGTLQDIMTAISGKGRPNILGVCIVLGISLVLVFILFLLFFSMMK